MVVPELVELGSEDILLDCDFDYIESEKYQLDIKWYFNGEPSPFFQWVPGQMSKPQIIGERFRDHVDVDHSVHTDSYKSHRALLLKRPSLELSGVYTCKVSTFLDEDVRRKRMVVYCKLMLLEGIRNHVDLNQINDANSQTIANTKAYENDFFSLNDLIVIAYY